MTRLSMWAVRVLPWLPALVAVVVTLRIRPFFGNMDDSRFVEGAGSTNPIEYAIAFFSPELGFVRSGSLAIVWPAARLGYHFGADTYFLTNVIVTTGCLAAFGLAYGRVVGWRNGWHFVAFMGFAFAWPYTAEMLFFPSLSEKGIILGGAALLLWIWALRTRLNTWLLGALLLVVTAFAFSTKTQILLLVPGAIALLWATAGQQDRRYSHVLRWVASILWSACSLGVIALARVGSYTSGTQGELGWLFVRDRRFQLLFGLALIYALALIWRLASKKYRAVDLAPGVYLLTIVAVFPIWEIRNYYLAVASVSVAAAATTFISWWRERIVSVIAIFAIVLSSVWLTYRLPQVYESLASVRQFLASSTAEQLAESDAMVAVSCAEAPVHYNVYADQFGLAGLEFEVAGNSSDDQTAYVFADSRLCPWPTAISRESWVPIWTSPYGAEAYTLYGK